MAWTSLGSLPARQYRCGYCVMNVGSDKGYACRTTRRALYFCPSCQKPTFFDDDGSAMPGAAPGNEVRHVPPELARLYREARLCAGAGAFTAAVLACRKILMSVAVTHGAAPGGSFASHVEYLATSGYVPPNGKGWVEHIRTKSNEAAHEIALMNQADAEELIGFAEMLLKFIYEFPARVPSAAGSVSPIAQVPPAGAAKPARRAVAPTPLHPVRASAAAAAAPPRSAAAGRAPNEPPRTDRRAAGAKDLPGSLSQGQLW